ncbi:MAG TPA: hypothetical protein VD978_19115 [Azospirillum sp.]|nr:hypothetical protein [Azospirillum sp.]
MDSKRSLPASRSSPQGSVEVVERGDIFFLYRPKVETEEAEGLSDVQRFFLVLRPEGETPMRLMIIGRKHLPDIDTHERVWGFVEEVTDSPEVIQEELGREHYPTKTRGERHQPPARPAGEGVYAVVQTGRRLHLAYELELPDRPGEVQRALNIAPQGSFAISVKNPEQGAPPGVGLGEEKEAHYPRRQQEEFRGRRFATEDVHLLDIKGAQLVLVGAHKDPEKRFGADLPAEDEALDTAEIFRQLRLKRKEASIEPLLRGDWR